MIHSSNKETKKAGFESAALPSSLKKNVHLLEFSSLALELSASHLRHVDMAQLLKESGVVDFQERLRVSDVRRLNRKEIFEQYHPAYIRELIRQAQENAENLRMPQRRWRKMEEESVG